MVDLAEGRRLRAELKAARKAVETALLEADNGVDLNDPLMRDELRAEGHWLKWMGANADALLNPWRPISEMPQELRDGRAVLLWAPDYSDEPALWRWSEATSAWHTDCGSMEDGPSDDPDLCSGPTHFREIEAPGGEG